MKSKVIFFLLAISLLIPFALTKAATPNNLNGKILLQVESKGEAWYVNPKDSKRYYMANGDQAFQIMKTLGVGMSNKDVEKMKTDATYRKKFIGKILLQVESKGEAYYISSDGRYNYLKDGASAYQVMRKLGLGISNSNLSKITEYRTIASSNKVIANNASASKCDSFECLANLVNSCVNGSGGIVKHEIKSTESTSMGALYTSSIYFNGLDSNSSCKVGIKIQTTMKAGLTELGSNHVSMSCSGKGKDLINWINKWENFPTTPDNDPKVICIVE